jgi:hypothetical protein
MPTEYGPVDLTWRLSRDGKRLDLKFSPHWRLKPGRIVLHVPPVAGLDEIVVNGRPMPAANESIELPNP